MLDIPEIKEACEDLMTTFLEPAAGEGAFLVAILERKLKMVSKKYNNDLLQYENYSLLTLTTLYGIELLEDNAQTCVMNMFQLYYDIYQKQAKQHEGSLQKEVLDSAKEIISSNIKQGNFLTRKTIDGNPLVFSEWKPINMGKTTKNIQVQRKEYTLDEIYEIAPQTSKNNESKQERQPEQMDMFGILEADDFEIEKEDDKKVSYVPVYITDVYKAEMEAVSGSNSD